MDSRALMQRFLSLGLALLVATPVAAQQAYRIGGAVRDAATGDGIAGVQVSLQGTAFGALTDNTGRYAVQAQVPSGDYTLEFTYLGRESARVDVSLGANRAVSVRDVFLSETALELEEIVVTGTAAPTARRAIGNAVSTVSASQLESTTATTLDQAIQGRVPGALITSNTGTPGGGVSIRLRGTSSIIGGAEPLYIVDGVVVDNSSDQVINVGYRSNPSNRLADLDPEDIDRIEILKGAAAAALYGSRANNGVVQIFTKRGRVGAPQVTVSTEVKRSTLPSRLDFALTPVDLDGNPVQRFDHQDLIFRDAWSNETHASISGGTEETRYYASAGYTGEKGIMEASDYEKFNVRLNLDQTWDDFSISAGGNYIRTENDLVINGEQGVGGLLTSIVFTPTTVNLAERNPETGELVNEAFVFPNPLAVIEDWETPQDVSRFVGSLMARAHLLDLLNIRYSFGYDTYSMETHQFIPRGSTLSPLGESRSVVRDASLINNDLVASAEWEAGAALGMTTSAGLNHTFTSEEDITAAARDLSPLTTLVRGAVQSASEALIETTTLGFFTQQQVTWDDRLFLTGALRWDASSTFGEDERWQLYPKISGSWSASDEAWWEDSPGRWLDELRLRAAWGQAGNQPPKGQAYARFPRYVNTTHVDRLGLVHSANAGNPNLKPERQTELELGFDASMFENRLALAFTWYDQTTEDLLTVRPFSPSTGFGFIVDNIGELSNRGVELELNTVNLDRSGLRWSSTFIFSKNENELVELVGDPFSVGYNNRVAEGHELGAFKMTAFARDSLTGEILTDEVGPLRADTSRFVGSPWPDFTASLANEIRIGDRWSASFLLDGQFGHQIWNQTQRIMDIFGAGPLFDQVLRKEVTPEFRARMQGIQEAYLEDATFVKLRDLSVRYRTPPDFADRLGLSALEVTLVGRNLYTWTEYSGYDPEVNMFGTSTVARGVDFAVYPHPRTWAFGVRAVY